VGGTLAAAASSSASDSYAGQIEALFEAVRGKRVGLLTNPTGVDGSFTQLADILNADAGTTVTAFFAPEHGLRGDQQAGAGINDYIDPYTGIPVYSVYGSRQAPTAEQLKNVDVLIFDIQDVGVRYYTYVWTMTHAMEAAAAAGVGFVVFDRPNPVGAHRVEGAPNTVNYGLVGRLWPGQPFGVSTRHGLTPGELARLVNGEWMNPKVDLRVIAIPGYQRDDTFEKLGRQWIAPSPNMPTMDTAFCYIATCVFERTNLSEGRGTTRPFEWIGAPFVNGIDWARDLNAVGLPGVRFRSCYFIPSWSKHAGLVCGGVQLHVLDREAYDPQRTGLWMLKTLATLYPAELEIRSNAGLFFGVENLDSLIRNQTVDSIIASWQANLTAFKTMREKYLIYPAKNHGLLVR
jgi:beta-N-acetylhexosaminidase